MKHSVPFRKIAERLTTGSGELYVHHAAIRATVNNLGTALEGLEALAGSRSPLETKEKHTVRIADAAKKLSARIDGAEGRISETVQFASREIDAAINQKAGLQEDSYAPEIRSAVRRMPEKERIHVLTDAVRAGDARAVAALTNGPALASGFNADFQATMREQFREVHAAAEYQAMNDLHRMMGDSATAIRVARDAARAAVNPDYLAQIEADQERAAKAQAAFDDSLQ